MDEMNLNHLGETMIFNFEKHYTFCRELSSNLIGCGIRTWTFREEDDVNITKPSSLISTLTSEQI